MASIKKTEFGTHRAIVKRAGYKTETSTFKTKQEANDFVALVLTKWNAGTQVVKNKEAKVKTVGDLFDRYIAACETVFPNGRTEIEVAKSSINTAKRVRANAAFITRRLSQISPEDISDWRTARLKEVEPCTVDREMTAISSVFRQAIEWREPVAFNPVRLVLRPKYNKDGRWVEWHDEQIEAVCAVLGYEEGVYPNVAPVVNRTSKARGTGLRDSCASFVAYAFLFALETSMRQGEIARLTVADYNRQDGYVQVLKSKNGSKRKVSLNTRATELIDVLCEGQHRDRIIFHYTGGTIGNYFGQARQAAGIEGLTFHDSRHEAITRMVPQFTNLAELAEQTGHKKLQSLKIYYNPTHQTIRSRLLAYEEKMAYQKTGGQLRSVA